MGLFGVGTAGMGKTLLAGGLAPAVAMARAKARHSPEADGYNTIYEKDGQYYTRAANPEYKREEPPKGGMFAGLGRAVANQIIKSDPNEGVDPYIYTAVANPYAPAAEVAEIAPVAAEDFAEGTTAPTVNIMPQPQQQVAQQPVIVYDPYTMARGLGDVQNPLFSGLRGNY